MNCATKTCTQSTRQLEWSATNPASSTRLTYPTPSSSANQKTALRFEWCSISLLTLVWVTFLSSQSTSSLSSPSGMKHLKTHSSQSATATTLGACTTRYASDRRSALNCCAMPRYTRSTPTSACTATPLVPIACSTCLLLRRSAETRAALIILSWLENRTHHASQVSTSFWYTQSQIRTSGMRLQRKCSKQSASAATTASSTIWFVLKFTTTLLSATTWWFLCSQTLAWFAWISVRSENWTWAQQNFSARLRIVFIRK